MILIDKKVNRKKNDGDGSTMTFGKREGNRIQKSLALSTKETLAMQIAFKGTMTLQFVNIVAPQFVTLYFLIIIPITTSPRFFLRNNLQTVFPHHLKHTKIMDKNN